MFADELSAAQVAERLGPIADADRLAADIAEPLAISAPIAYAVAHSTCRVGEPATDCRAYHAVWQYLRLTGLARSVRNEGPLFVAAAARRARMGRLRRVLVCGTADYSMLAYLGHAARHAGAETGAETEFDVLDRCGTTLHMNKWYAARSGLRLRAIAANVFDFVPDRSYDLICAHSFLPWIDYDARPRLIRLWRDWLSVDGELCISNRVDEAAGPKAAHDRAPRLNSMQADFFRRCDDMELVLPADRDSFRALLEQHGGRALDRRRDMPAATIRGWLAAAGLALDLAVPVAGIVPGYQDRASAPLATAGRPSMWFLARRA